MMDRLREWYDFWAIPLGFVALTTGVLLSFMQQNQLGAGAALCFVLLFFIWGPKLKSD